MKRALSLVLALVLLWITVCAMDNANTVGNQCRSVSLRYGTPVSSEAAAAAQEKQPGLAFWSEETVSLSTEWRHVQTSALLFAGDVSLVWGQTCSSGAMPAVFDSAGCAVSSALAQALFGSNDVVGLTFSWEGRICAVRGVWESEELMAVLPARNVDFTAVEIPMSDEAGRDPDGWVDTVLLKSGLPEPDWTLFTETFSFFARAMAFLPLVFASAVLAAALGRRLTEYSFPARDAVVFAVLLAVALALPIILAAWPQWMIPSRWSDFAWWGQTARKIGEQLKDWFAAPGIGRDLAVKTGLFTQMFLAAAQCVLCEALRCRFRAKAAARYRE